jgi:PAS domain S-box-containing protein
VLRDAFDRARTEGEPYDVTLRLLPASGEQRWVRTRGEPQFDGDELVRIRGSFRDVTERKEREEELRRYEAIIEALDDAVYAVDDRGQVRYVNERYAEMKDADCEEIIGTPMRQWVADEEADRIYTLVDELQRGELDVAVLEYEFLTTAGQRIPAEVRFTDLEFPDGRHGRAGVIRDITERTRRERELERQNERLDEFVSVVSHDLRNPLTVAEGNLELAREERASDHLDRAADAIDRCQSLIDDLLTLAREGEVTPDTEPVALADVAERSWHTVDTKAASLTVDTTRTIRADAGRLQQLFENLYRNAVEHGSTSNRTKSGDSEASSTPRADGEAVDSVEHSDDGVTVRVGEMDGGFYVADDGPGIPEADRDAVFDAGYSTTTDGTGLGLRIVDRVAEAHGWTLAVTEAEGGGARFEVTGVDIVD